MHFSDFCRIPDLEGETWPQYSKNNPLYYIFNAEGTEQLSTEKFGRGPMSSSCAFWNHFLPKFRSWASECLLLYNHTPWGVYCQYPMRHPFTHNPSSSFSGPNLCENLDIDVNTISSAERPMIFPMCIVGALIVTASEYLGKW